MSTILPALAVLAATTPGLLVSPAELAASLKDPATVVIAVGNSDDDFIAGHIPGARFVRYDDIAIDADGLTSELPPVDQLRKVLSAAGISDKSKVVIYGSRDCRRPGCSSRSTTSGTRTRRCSTAA